MMGNARDRKEGSYCFNCKFWRGGDTPMEPDGTPAEGWCGFTLADGAQLYHDTLGVTKSNNWCCLWMARKDEDYMDEIKGTMPSGLPECPYQIGKLAYTVVIGSAVSISIGNGNRVEKMQMPYVMAATVDVLMTDGEQWIPYHKNEHGEIEPLANACKAVFGFVYATKEDAEKTLNELVENYQKAQRHYIE